jgi:hypothetical protein
VCGGAYLSSLRLSLLSPRTQVVRVSFNVLDQNFLQSEQYKSHKDSYSWSDVQKEYSKMAAAEGARRSQSPSAAAS